MGSAAAAEPPEAESEETLDDDAPSKLDNDSDAAVADKGDEVVVVASTILDVSRLKVDRVEAMASPEEDIMISTRHPAEFPQTLCQLW